MNLFVLNFKKINKSKKKNKSKKTNVTMSEIIFY